MESPTERLEKLERSSTVKLTASGSTSQLLQQLQSHASGGPSVQLAFATSALKDSLENEELLQQLLQSVGKGENLNVEA